MELTREWTVVYFVDDVNREPHLVKAVLDNGDYVLGIKDCPDTEQDFETPRELVRRFPTREEEMEAKSIIVKKLKL